MFIFMSFDYQEEPENGYKQHQSLQAVADFQFF